MDLKDIEEWGRELLQSEARKRGVKNPEVYSRTELMRLILQDYGAPTNVREAARLIGGILGSAKHVLKERLEAASAKRLQGGVKVYPGAARSGEPYADWARERENDGVKQAARSGRRSDDLGAVAAADGGGRGDPHARSSDERHGDLRARSSDEYGRYAEASFEAGARDDEERDFGEDAERRSDVERAHLDAERDILMEEERVREAARAARRDSDRVRADERAETAKRDSDRPRPEVGWHRVTIERARLPQEFGEASASGDRASHVSLVEAEREPRRENASAQHEQASPVGASLLSGATQSEQAADRESGVDQISPVSSAEAGSDAGGDLSRDGRESQSAALADGFVHERADSEQPRDEISPWQPRAVDESDLAAAKSGDPVGSDTRLSDVTPDLVRATDANQSTSERASAETEGQLTEMSPAQLVAPTANQQEVPAPVSRKSGVRRATTDEEMRTARDVESGRAEGSGGAASDRNLANEAARAPEIAPIPEGVTYGPHPHDGMLLRWRVSEEAIDRARKVLGAEGELAVRVVAVRVGPHATVKTDVIDHGPVRETGNWTAPLAPTEARYVTSIGLRSSTRFVSIAHTSS